MSKCKIVLTCEDKSFLGRVVGMIRQSLASQGGPIGAMETSCEFDGCFTMTAEPFAESKPLSFTFGEFCSTMRQGERGNPKTWGIETLARWVLVEDALKIATEDLKKRAADLAKAFQGTGSNYFYHRQLAELVAKGVINGISATYAASCVLEFVDEKHPIQRLHEELSAAASANGFSHYNVRDVALHIVASGGLVDLGLRDRCMDLKAQVKPGGNAAMMLELGARVMHRHSNAGLLNDFAKAVLSEVDATCEAGEEVVNTCAIEPLPAQLGCIHSAEAIALAGLVIQLVGDHPESRAYRLADKIVKEATGVTRG